MKRVILTVLITIVVMVFVPLVVLATGWVNMSASNDPGVVETSLAQLAVGRSTAIRAPDEDNPFADDKDVIAIGQRHYADTCLSCHGTPGVKPMNSHKVSIHLHLLCTRRVQRRGTFLAH
jgi:hypothetical protein